MARSSGTPVTLTEEDRKRLEGIMKNPQSRRKHAWRADIILNLGAGFGPSETRRRTGKSIPTIQRWRKRFLAEGVDGLLYDATRPPGRAPIPGERAKALIEVAMSPPPPHLSHWTLSALAEKTGMVRSTIHNILKRHGLEPHRTRTSGGSRELDFKGKIHGI